MRYNIYCQLKIRGGSDMNKLRLVIGSDEAGFSYKELIKNELATNKNVTSIFDIGITGEGLESYPEIALMAGEMIKNGDADRGILMCGTGLGMAISANKVPGIFAVTAHDSYSVERSILSNNVQVLCLGQRVIGIELARKLVNEWLELTFDVSSPSSEKISIISAYEEGSGATK